ncbi:MAG: Zn-dependent hydrolase, partial [bacterium]
MIGPILLLLFAAPSSLDVQLAKWKPAKMPLDAAALSSSERQLVDKLVEASQYMERIYWEQADPEALRLFRTTHDPKLRRALTINGCRFDLIDGNNPFICTQPIAPGRNLYPAGLTRAEIESYVRAHPAQKDALYSGYTIVRRRGAKLETIPYHIAYK